MIYDYSGPVMKFGVNIGRWKGQTTAPSKVKAKSNLEYQYKQEHGLKPNTRITISEKFIITR